MSERTADAGKPILRSLPSIDELLRLPEVDIINQTFGKQAALRLARKAVESMRREATSSERAETVLSDAGPDHLTREALRRMQMLAESDHRNRLTRVINATGVIIHTNLGRAPLSDKARQAMNDIAAGYCTTEFDLDSGERGRRGQGAENLISEITGAEAALIVNNCAAAALLVLSVVAAGREVIISRGELVEIGGDFRVPDVLSLSGAVLREVGTTNRTKLSDYERAINEKTAMILRVHPSNYRIVGFTASPSNGDLALLAHQHGLTFYEDAGSGALCDLEKFGIEGEPSVKGSLVSGVDIVSFSGDKLLGGPQAGILVGRHELIERLRRHTFYRALRANKLIYAALESTLLSFLLDRHLDEVPILRMIAEPKEEILKRAEHLKEILTASTEEAVDLSIGITDGTSAVGGGAAPETGLKTVLLAISAGQVSASEMASRLRRADPPVIARIGDDRVLIDLRTVDRSEEEELVNAIRSAIKNLS